MKNTECPKWIWNKECVNVGKFADGECLMYKTKMGRPCKRGVKK